MSPSNPDIYVIIKYLEIGALLMQLLLFSLRMVPLVHVHMYVNNTVAQGWTN